MSKWTLHLDYETGSVVDLKKVGAHRYLRDPLTRVLCAAYGLRRADESFDPSIVKPWRTWAGDPMPDDLADALADPDVRIEAWNSQFERLANAEMFKRFDAAEKTDESFGDYEAARVIERYRCTAARARAVALNGKLELAARCLGLQQQKDMDGNRLMLKLTKLLPDGACIGTEEEMEKLTGYCVQDVRTEGSIGNVIRDLTAEEWQDFFVQEYINDRGIPVDVELAHAVQFYAKDELAIIRKELADLTCNQVQTPRQFDKIKEWLTPRIPEPVRELMKVPVKGSDKYKISFDKTVREAMVEDDEVRAMLTDEVLDFISLIDDAGRASTSKFATIEARATTATLEPTTGRVLGAYVFNGGGQTGRASAQGFQAHNMVRDKLKNVEQVVAAIMARKPVEEVILAAGFDEKGDPYNILTILARLIRPTVVAEDGKVLVWGDWSAIEARCLPWLTLDPDAESLLNQFRKNEDVYLSDAAGIYGVPVSAITKEDPRRQIGKVARLSMGFLGGAGALRKMARGYKVKMDEQTAEYIKRAWRANNPWAMRFGEALHTAAINAVLHPGTVHDAGRLAYHMPENGETLWCLLPGGRIICYPEARVDVVDGQWGPQRRLSAIKGSWKPKGNAPWPRIGLWPGLLCLTGDTEVLTPAGWTKLVDVGAQMVWDGHEFVEHKGCVLNGMKPVGYLDGVGMTADHQVLASRGWQDAEKCTGLDRRTTWLPDSSQTYKAHERQQARKSVDMGASVRLRDQEDDDWNRVQQRQRKILWLPDSEHDRGCSQNTRNVEAPCFRSMASDDRSLQAANTPSMAQLRSPRHTRLSAMADVVREFLGRHGTNIRSWFVDRPERQQRQLHAEKLSLDDARRAVLKPAHQSAHRDALGSAHGERSCAQVRHWCDDDFVSIGAEMAFGAYVHRTGPRQPVYDLVDCGPRHQFVVRGANGPFIVHNCENATQATCASILRATMRTLHAGGWPLVMTTHDEPLMEVFEDEKDEALTAMKAAMLQPLPWLDGMPLDADFAANVIYGK